MDQNDINEIIAKHPSPEAEIGYRLRVSANPELFDLLEECHRALRAISKCITLTGVKCAPNDEDLDLVIKALDKLNKAGFHTG